MNEDKEGGKTSEGFESKVAHICSEVDNDDTDDVAAVIYSNTSPPNGNIMYTFSIYF